MDIEYYKKLQNAHGTRNKREKELIKVNRNSSKHFDDTFDTEDVLVNNKPMQLMIVHDTDLNVHKKKIKSRHEDIFNLGDYVIWNDQVWLITLVDPDNKTWNRGYMYLCTILLRWQNSEGRIVERWCYSEDYTKYSMGEKGNSTITVGDYQYGLTIPVDEETKQLNRTNRFVIDYEGVYPPDTYRMTGKKGFLSDVRYVDKGGVMTVTLSYEQFNEVTDKLIELENGTKAWICNYKSPTTPTLPPSEPDNPTTSAAITGGDTLRYGRAKTWTVTFSDSENQPNFTWNVKSDFKITQNITGNKIQLKCTDDKAIDCTFTLQVLDNESNILSETTITIVG